MVKSGLPGDTSALGHPGQTPLLFLAVMWAMLWVLVSVIESAAYLHDPSVPFWQPLALICILACTLAAWLTFELRSVRYLAVPLDPPRPWFVRQLRRLPMLASGYVVLVIGLRHGVFAIAGAHYWHAPWPILIPFELVKASLFYCLWLGLVFGTLSQIRSREQAVQLGLIEKALVEAQLARLRAQLRPHFLFNALNTVSSLMQDDVQRADRLLTRLGDLLRASLNATESDTVPLHEEIRLLRIYAEIMQERFTGRITVDWQIAEDALNLRVPAMLLQPLLENAFKHGVERTTDNVHIRISAGRLAERLSLTIHNTGSTLQPGWFDGVGLANCRERLRVLYGDAAALSITGGNAGGVEAAIVLPYGSGAA
jgi:two-component system, LytTR family, sensor kinase